MTDGLGRVDRQVLLAVDGGARTLEELHAAQIAGEERPFLGDAALALHLDRLVGGAAPLLERRGDAYRLTNAGLDVLSGRADAVRLNGIDRWLGGVQLPGREAEWRWDPGRGQLQRA